MRHESAPLFAPEGVLSMGARRFVRFDLTLKRVVNAIRKTRTSHAIIGAVAVGQRRAPRATTDIDLLLDPAGYHSAIAAIRKAGIEPRPDGFQERELWQGTDPKTGVGVDLMFGVGDPEESARETAEIMRIFDVS